MRAEMLIINQTGPEVLAMRTNAAGVTDTCDGIK